MGGGGPLSKESSSSSPTRSSSSQQQQQPQRRRQRNHCQRLLSALVLLLALIFYTLLTKDGYLNGALENDAEPLYNVQGDTNGGDEGNGKNNNNNNNAVVLPKALIDMGIYQPELDFENSLGIAPPFWRLTNSTKHAKQKTNKEDTSSHEPPLDLQSWGPCYPPHAKIHWKDTNDTTHQVLQQGDNTQQQPQYRYRHKPHNDGNMQEYKSVQGGCRPGFLIIGAGKCGTSSLYHYLVAHPRVAPAYSKQIHYFKYHLSKPLGWYYSWFPTAETYLESGTLLTGEASPGYLPYPGVVQAIQKLMPGPKVIMAARNPLERIYSSYKYNYVQPTFEAMKNGKIAGVPSHQDDDFYQTKLFSLEDLVRAELKQLQDCLYGFGIEATRRKWYNKPWVRDEFDAREHFNLDPLIDLDEVCYGNAVNQTVLRPQWAELQMTYPHKVIGHKNTFLIQAMLGRSLYVLPLEWWYISFPREDILFVCTEELSDPQMLGDLALQLGLPSFDFTDAVGEGAYNVGGHRGYDEATTWDQLQKETVEEEDENNNDNKHHQKQNAIDDIPLSLELRTEVLDFIRPFNERLFELTGKRCDWY